MTKRTRNVKRVRRARPPRLGIRALAHRLGELEQRVDEVEGDGIDIADLARRLDDLEAAVRQIQRLAGLRG